MLDAAGSPPLLFDYPSTRVVHPVQVAELPCHHGKRQHLLANAKESARLSLPDSQWLAATALPLMPRRPRASQNLRAITRDPSTDLFLLDEAITLPWCATDSETHRNALLIDIDHDDAIDRWAELPEHVRPTLVLDPWSGRAHAVAWLASPVLLASRDEIAARRGEGEVATEGREAADGGKAPEKKAALLGPQMMADLAGRLLAAALGGTLLPPGSLVKSPWGLTKNLIGTRKRIGPRPVWEHAWHDMQARGLMWSTRDGAGPIELRPLVAALADRWWHETAGATPRFSTARYAKKRGDPSWLSRNSWVFDLTRWWAYDREERDTAAITEAALGFNADLATPLPPGDVRATARSIARFMTARFRPRVGSGTGTRGRDAIDGAGLSVTEKRALAGRESAKAHAAGTDSKIAAGVAKLATSGTPITQVAVAVASGVSLRTVKRRWNRVPDGVLSGSGAPRATPGPEAPSFKDQNPSLSLACRAQADRRLKAIVAQLAALAAAAMKPAAVPRPVPEIPADLSGCPAVRKAAAAARLALLDAERRASARSAKQATADRLAEFIAAASAPSPWTWWDNYRAALDAEFDAREQEPGLDRHALAGLRASREATFAARWRLWKRVTRPPHQVSPTQPSAIPDEEACFLADLDRVFGPSPD